MQAISFERSGVAQTAVVSVATLAALVLLGLVLAYWTWAWFAPLPEPAAPAAAQTGARLQAAPLLFGSAPDSQAAAAPTGLAIRLLGIVADTGGSRGYAVVQLQGKELRAVGEGEDIAAGIRLAEVRTGEVILERGGVREMLALPQKVAAVAPVSTPTQAPPAPTPTPEPAPAPVPATAPPPAQ